MFQLHVCFPYKVILSSRKICHAWVLHVIERERKQSHDHKVTYGIKGLAACPCEDSGETDKHLLGCKRGELVVDGCSGGRIHNQRFHFCQLGDGPQEMVTLTQP